MRLQRTSQTDVCTLGELKQDGGEHVAITLELPWRENRRGTSCIPAGSYTCTRRFSPSHGKELFWVDGVPDRDAIEVHIGNTTADTQGCILVGQGVAPGSEAIEHSRLAFASLMAMLDGVDSFPLEVVGP